MDVLFSAEYDTLHSGIAEAKQSLDKAENNELKERYALLDARLAAELICRFLIKHPLEPLSADAAKERERFRDDAPRITQFSAVLKVMYSNSENLLIKPLKHISDDTNSELHAGRPHALVSKLASVRNNLISLENWVADKYGNYILQCEQSIKKKASDWNTKYNSFVRLLVSPEGLQRITTQTDSNRDLFDVMLLEKSVILIGGRGAGKTYSCKAAVSYFSYLKSISDDCPIDEAFYVYIGDCSDNSNTIIKAIEESGYLFGSSNQSLLLIDGFHEIKPEYRLKATEDLSRLLNKSPENLRILITARKETRPNLPVEAEYRLLGFNHLQIEEYISKNLIKSAFDAENLSGLICKKAPRLHRLAHTPIFLKMMVSLYNNSTVELETLPVGQLVEKFIENELLGNEYPETYKKMLSDIAFQLMTADCSHFTESDLEQISSCNICGDIKAFLKINLENGVLTKNDRKYEFAHEVYRDYFVSQALLNLRPEDWSNYINRKPWHGVFVLLAGVSDMSNFKKEFLFNRTFEQHHSHIAASALPLTISDNGIERQWRNNIVKFANENIKSTNEHRIADGLLALTELDMNNIIDSFFFSCSQGTFDLYAFKNAFYEFLKESPAESILEITESLMRNESHALLKTFMEQIEIKGTTEVTNKDIQKTAMLLDDVRLDLYSKGVLAYTFLSHEQTNLKEQLDLLLEKLNRYGGFPELRVAAKLFAQLNKGNLHDVVEADFTEKLTALLDLRKPEANREAFKYVLFSKNRKAFSKIAGNIAAILAAQDDIVFIKMAIDIILDGQFHLDKSSVVQIARTLLKKNHPASIEIIDHYNLWSLLNSNEDWVMICTHESDSDANCILNALDRLTITKTGLNYKMILENLKKNTSPLIVQNMPIIAS